MSRGWRLRTRTLPLDRPLLMGIVNVTPDSFSDGGAFLDPQAAITQGKALAEAGADLIDVGGESTRPGAAEVSADDELARVIGVVAALAGQGLAVSIDTDTMPYKVLQVRGSVRTDVVDGVAPEYESMTIRCLGEEQGREWLGALGAMCPQMARIFVTPEWVAILDFEQRFPSALERAMEGSRP